MKAREIIEQLAREATVEKLVANIAGQPVDGDLSDLCQMIYEALLQKSPRQIKAMYAKAGRRSETELHGYIIKLITNQLRSKTSRYYYTFKLPRAREIELTEIITDSSTDES